MTEDIENKSDSIMGDSIHSADDVTIAVDAVVVPDLKEPLLRFPKSKHL